MRLRDPDRVPSQGSLLFQLIVWGLVLLLELACVVISLVDGNAREALFFGAASILGGWIFISTLREWRAFPLEP